MEKQAEILVSIPAQSQIVSHFSFLCRLIELNKMRASEELGPEQARQFLFDLENAHNLFCRSVSE